MVSLIVKKATKGKTDAEKRTLTGKICGVFGILLNVLLFVFKLVTGMLCGSISITADAFNNLSDAGSSIITLVGFRLAEKKPDPDHPFGHGRIEYVSGLIVSFMIVLMGIELLKSSIEGLIEPSIPEFNVIVAAVLVTSVFIKLYVYSYNKRLGKSIGSAAMLATAQDSLADTFSTTAVLIGAIVSGLTQLYYVDAICGLILSVYILYSGVRAAKETVSPLLGQPPSPDFVKKIEEIALSEPLVIGIHDMIVHDYGPGRLIVSLHCEVSSEENVIELHEAIDGVECRIMNELNCMAIIHMDPVDIHDPVLIALNEALPPIVKQISPSASYHDLRVVRAASHINVIFDVLLPAGASVDYKSAKNFFKEEIKKTVGDCECIVNFDTDFVGKASQED